MTRPAPTVTVPDAKTVCATIAPYLGATDANDWAGLEDDDAISMPVKMRVGDLRALKAVVSAPAAPQATGVGEREAIARICDPAAWRTRDEQYTHIERSRIVKDKDAARRNADAYVSGTLKKADLILSLRAPSREPEGGAVDELAAQLARSIAGLGYPVGLGQAPNEADCQKAATAILMLYGPTLATREEAPAEAGAWKRCGKCGAGPAGNCGYYGCETPRNTCPLRAQPQAREDAQPVAWLDAAQKNAAERAAMDARAYSWRNARLAMVEGDKVIGYPAFSRADMAELARLHTHPAPDALRVAVEALKMARTGYCVLRTIMKAKDLSEGYATALEHIDAIDQALAALQAEQGAK